MELANTALLGKEIWSLMHKPNKLWVRVLTHKYLSNASVLQVQSRPIDSPVWKGLSTARDRLRPGFSFRMGSGATSLWHEDWSDLGNIASAVPYIDIHDVGTRLSDLVVNDIWNVQVLHTPLPEEVLVQLQ